MHWHQSLLMVISNVSGKKSRNTTPATWLTVTERIMKLGPRILPICGMIIISNCSIQWMIQMTSLMFCPILGITLIPLMPWLPFMIRYVPSKSFLTTNLLDLRAFQACITSSVCPGGNCSTVYDETWFSSSTIYDNYACSNFEKQEWWHCKQIKLSANCSVYNGIQNLGDDTC